ncbi:MAG: DNA polymerase Y family protein, partial [Acidimicrobiales bacterium]
MPAGPAEPRTLVVHCPDWPVVAAGLADRPAAVLWAGRVVAASPAARAEGVRPGQRRREAEAACPALVIAERDVPREVGAFEKVVATVGEFAPRVEVTSPGVCSLPV